VVDEDCFPYAGSDEPCDDKCPAPDEIIRINDQDGINPLDGEENIKRNLIDHGPLNFGIDSWWHSMVLVGFDKDPDDDETIWILKNSWGTGWGENGYGSLKVALSDMYCMNVLTPPVTSHISSFETVCLDSDDDGYYNWGISEDKPPSCPTNTSPYKDCDDYNPSLGPFDVNGHCKSIQLFRAAVNYSTGFNARAVAIGDLDNDGNQDLAVASAVHPEDGEGGVSVLLGKGDGTFHNAVNYVDDEKAMYVDIGDLNGDGNLDLASVYRWCSYDVLVRLGNGDGTFQSPVNCCSGDRFVTMGDMNGDGNLDLVTDSSVNLGNGDGTFQSPQSFDNGRSGAIGHLNGDAHLDLVVVHEGDWNAPYPAPGNVTVLLSNGDGTFQSEAQYSAGFWPKSVAIDDLNRDGDLDLAVANDRGEISVLLGNGNGTFLSAVNYETAGQPRCITIGDLNGDSNLDLAVASLGSGVSVLFGNGNGTFQNAVYYEAGSHSKGVAISDLNGDSYPDLAVANGKRNNVSILINTGWVKLPISSVAASDYQTGNPPEHTIDGDLDTRWSAFGDGQWIEFDLGSTTNVGYVKIAWYRGDDRIATFDIEASSDGINWSQIYSGQSSGTTVNHESYDFNDLTARYVRIVGHGNTENDWNSINEVEIYGRDDFYNTCPGDFNDDKDVDGLDFVDYLIDSKSLGLDVFATSFGKVDCP
jgi:hypothetical protein